MSTPHADDAQIPPCYCMQRYSLCAAWPLAVVPSDSLSCGHSVSTGQIRETVDNMRSHGNGRFITPDVLSLPSINGNVPTYTAVGTEGSDRRKWGLNEDLASFHTCPDTSWSATFLQARTVRTLHCKPHSLTPPCSFPCGTFGTMGQLLVSSDWYRKEYPCMCRRCNILHSSQQPVFKMLQSPWEARPCMCQCLTRTHLE
jgi:hypothetical protein